jgi:molybdenum cofactor cytidylyltransferase
VADKIKCEMKDLAITGLIVSAGKSGRMGSFKPLMDYKGKTFLERIILNLNSVCEEIVVVTGFNSESLQKETINQLSNKSEVLLSDKIRFVENENYANGMFTSLQKGLSLIGSCDWILYHFVDQPGLPIEFYKEFIAQIDQIHNWIQPSYDNRNGHPILFSNEIVDLILSSNENSNLRELSKSSIAKKKRWDCTYKNVLQDIDTQEDYLASMNPGN